MRLVPSIPLVLWVLLQLLQVLRVLCVLQAQGVRDGEQQVLHAGTGDTLHGQGTPGGVHRVQSGRAHPQFPSLDQVPGFLQPRYKVNHSGR